MMLNRFLILDEHTKVIQGIPRHSTDKCDIQVELKNVAAGWFSFLGKIN